MVPRGRRLASSSRLATLFLVAASLALAVFVASQAMVSSLRTTVDAKAKVFVGSDVRLQIGPDTQVPPDLGFPATIATRSRQMGRFTDTDRSFDMVAIDPATFGSAAYWNDAFSDRSVPELMDLLSDGSGDRLPVVMANRQGPIPVELEIQRQIVPIEVVAEATSVPGTSSDRPVFMVSEERLRDAFAGLPDPLHEAQTTREMWIRGPSDEALKAASAAGVESYLTITANEVADIPFIKAAIDTFLILDVLGVVALILVLIVAIVYLQARQRSRIVSMALSERMGLQEATMRRSLVFELAVLLFGGLAVGAATGLIGAAIVIPYLDPLPTIPRARSRSSPSPSSWPPPERSRSSRSSAAGWPRGRPEGFGWGRCCALSTDGEAVRCEGIERVYRTPTGEVHALHDVTGRFPRGVVTAIVGPSGSGKSSLLRLIAGMDRPNSGSLVVEGRDVGRGSAKARRRLRRDLVGYIYQRPSDNFLAHLTVGEHLRLAGRRRGSTALAPDRLLDLLEIGGSDGPSPLRAVGRGTATCSLRPGGRERGGRHRRGRTHRGAR